MNISKLNRIRANAKAKWIAANREVERAKTQADERRNEYDQAKLDCIAFKTAGLPPRNRSHKTP